jgi:hypothetical protein
VRPSTRRQFLGCVPLLVVGCSDRRAPDPAPTSTAEPEAPPAPDFWLGIKPGIHSAARIEPSMPAELGAIQVRFADAASKNQQWLLAYTREHEALAAGAPLPYHPNLGVTADEYRRLLDAYDKPIFVERERFQIDVKLGDALTLALPSVLAPETPLTIERSGRVTYGSVAVAEPKRVTDQKAKFGLWSGYAWQHASESNSTESLETAVLDNFSLDLGRIAPDRQLFFYLARTRVSEGRGQGSHTLLAKVDG